MIATAALAATLVASAATVASARPLAGTVDPTTVHTAPAVPWVLVSTGDLIMLDTLAHWARDVQAHAGDGCPEDAIPSRTGRCVSLDDLEPGEVRTP